MYKIFIAENVPSLNKGEKTILEGMLETFKAVGEVEVYMLSARPDIDTPRYGPKIKIVDIRKCLPFSNWLHGRRSKIFLSILVILQHLFFFVTYKILGSRVLRFFGAVIWQAYLKCDVIVLGHNGALSLTWGPVLFYPLFVPLFAKMLGKPCVFYGGSVAPRKTLLRRIFQFVLDRMDLITLRETISRKNLKDYGLRNKQVFVTADPALLLQPVGPERVEEIMKREGIDGISGPLIGMTITRRMAYKAFPQLDSLEMRYRRHTEMLAQFIDDLTHKYGATVIFLPHSIGFGKEFDDRAIGFGDQHDDRIVAKHISQMCRNENRVRVITNEYDADELKGLIGRFDFFIGERIHSVVNAMTMFVPSIVISFSSDQRLGIIEMLTQGDFICHVEDLDSEVLLAKVNDVWSRKEEIREDMKSQTRILQERAMLNGKLLKRLLDSQSITGAV